MFQAIVSFLDFLMLTGVVQKSTQKCCCEVHILLEGRSQLFI